MRILEATEDNIIFASRIVRRGGLVVYPTDTVYGLGCDPLNVKAVRRIFRAKGERKKALPVLASDMEHVKKITRFSEKAGKLAARFWPGPLTLVLPKKPTLPDVVTCNLGSVGVRMPRHDIAIQLIRFSGGLLVGTSANKTGMKSSRTAQEAAEQLGKEVDAILNGGPTPIGIASTIVNLTSERPRILREGPISLEEISDILSLERP